MPRNPWAIGEEDSHLLYRYSSRHIHFLPLHKPFRTRFAADRNAPLPSAIGGFAASAPNLFPIIIGAGILDQ